MTINFCGHSPISTGSSTPQTRSWKETRAATLARLITQVRAENPDSIFLIGTRGNGSIEEWRLYTTLSREDLSTEVAKDSLLQAQAEGFAFTVQIGSSRLPYEQFLKS